MTDAIRCATGEDVPVLAAMGVRFLATLYDGHLSGRMAPLSHMLQALIERASGCVLVAMRGPDVVGGICGHVYEHPMSGEKVAAELGWWVEPQARGAGVRLLRAFETWARDRGAQAVQLVAPTARVEEFYRRIGYAPVERLYQRRLP